MCTQAFFRFFIILATIMGKNKSEHHTNIFLGKNKEEGIRRMDLVNP
jgi:hypothetical protein